MRNTDCVKVQTIWTYTSKWSGCTMNMFVICLPSREKCLNIQRECVMSPVVNPPYASPCLTLRRVVIWFSCGCLRGTLFLHPWFSVFVCMFVPSGVLCHCPQHNSIPCCTVSPKISKALAIAWTVFKPLCACSVGFGQFLNSRLLDVCLRSCVNRYGFICMYVCMGVYECHVYTHTTGFVSKDNVFFFC